MRIAYLDCFSGISGDMFLGALLDAGVPAELLEKTVETLGVGARLEVSRVNRSGISATKVDVYSHGEKDLPREEFEKSRSQESKSGSQESGVGSQHRVGAELRSAMDGAETRPHTPAAEEHGHEHDHKHGHGRGLKEIREIIGKAEGISERAKSTAIAIFENLGAAEAKIHHVPIEKVHFHEVGAVDALVDICCAAVGAEALQVEEIICSPLNVGGGTVKCAHGTFPIPAPATLELLKNAPVYSGEIQKELVTPTGAAIVNVLAARFSSFPRMKPVRTGYGAGTRDFKDHPNVLRLTIGETLLTEDQQSLIPEELITILEANVDDMTPQVFGYVMERALHEGALDVFGTSVQMKKNRPGMLLT